MCGGRDIVGSALDEMTFQVGSAAHSIAHEAGGAVDLLAEVGSVAFQGWAAYVTGGLSAAFLSYGEADASGKSSGDAAKSAVVAGVLAYAAGKAGDALTGANGAGSAFNSGDAAGAGGYGGTVGYSGDSTGMTPGYSGDATYTYNGQTYTGEEARQFEQGVQAAQKSQQAYAAELANNQPGYTQSAEIKAQQVLSENLPPEVAQNFDTAGAAKGMNPADVPPPSSSSVIEPAPTSAPPPAPANTPSLYGGTPNAPVQPPTTGTSLLPVTTGADLTTGSPGTTITPATQGSVTLGNGGILNTGVTPKMIGTGLAVGGLAGGLYNAANPPSPPPQPPPPSGTSGGTLGKQPMQTPIGPGGESGGTLGKQPMQIPLGPDGQPLTNSLLPPPLGTGAVTAGQNTPLTALEQAQLDQINQYTKDNAALKPLLYAQAGYNYDTATGTVTKMTDAQYYASLSDSQKAQYDLNATNLKQAQLYASGNGPVSGATEEYWRKFNADRQQELANRLGPTANLSTPGIQTMSADATAESIAKDAERRGSMTTYQNNAINNIGSMQGQQQQGFNLAGASGNMGQGVINNYASTLSPYQSLYGSLVGANNNIYSQQLGAGNALNYQAAGAQQGLTSQRLGGDIAMNLQNSGAANNLNLAGYNNATSYAMQQAANNTALWSGLIGAGGRLLASY